MRAGLFGGSFNPAHHGHLAVAEAAKVACRLDRVVWLVSPGNPLKRRSDYRPLDERTIGARQLAAGRPWLEVSAIEDALGTRYTIDTLRSLSRLTRASLVWIMGADSLAGFSSWRAWRQIALMMPILVVSRPGQTMPALTSVAARALAGRRQPDPSTLPGTTTPAWSYVHTVHEPVSATAIRTLDGPGRRF